MSLASELWGQAQPTARGCLRHPFVQGLGDGTLEPERYRRFIAQDAFFLESFARGYAHCLARSPDRDGVYTFRRLLDGVFDELRLHERAASELEIDLATVDPLPATLAYTGFLDEVIGGLGSVGATLAAMTPCMRLYAFLGESLASGSPGSNPYQDWVDTYASEDFHDLADLIESLLERYSTGSEREAELYARAMELELAFFDAAWAGDAPGTGG